MPYAERRRFSPEDLDLQIPDFTFRPNVWTEVFLTGLDAVPVTRKRVAEIGVGTGIVGIDLLKRGVNAYVGLDIDARVLPIAHGNIVKTVPECLTRVILLQSDVLAALPEDRSFDLVCGCLPQVSRPSTVELGSADSYARYFDEGKYTSPFNVYGLGLNEAALVQSKTRLKPDGCIVLVLSGRGGKAVLEQLYAQHGYQPRVVFEDSIAQLRETTLATLVDAESRGAEFFFYKDPACHDRITVAQAEQRRQNGEDSYHKIYVIEGKPQ